MLENAWPPQRHQPSELASEGGSCCQALQGHPWRLWLPAPAADQSVAVGGVGPGIATAQVEIHHSCSQLWRLSQRCTTREGEGNAGSSRSTVDLGHPGGCGG